MFQLFYSPFSRIVVYQSRKEAVVFSCTPIFFCDKRSRFQPPFLVLPSTSIHSSVVCGLALFVLLFQMKYQKEGERDWGELEKQEAIFFQSFYPVARAPVGPYIHLPIPQPKVRQFPYLILLYTHIVTMLSGFYLVHVKERNQIIKYSEGME